MNRRILPAVLIIAGVVGLVTVWLEVMSSGVVPRWSAFTFPIGWVLFAILLISINRTMTVKDDLIARKQATNDRLTEQCRLTQTNVENLERQVSGIQDQLRSAQHAHSMVSLDLATQKLFVRRLNGICADNGIDTRAANVPPAEAGRELNSSRVARENPVAPPPVPQSLRGQVVSQRRSMSSPNPSSSPVIRDTDNGGFDGLMAGVLIGSMLSDDSSASPRREPEPTRCEPAPTYSEPVRSEPSYCEPTRSSGGDSWGGNSSSSESSSSSGDSGGGSGGGD
jgi:uncharacterized membrane protein YgcG